MDIAQGCDRAVPGRNIASEEGLEFGGLRPERLRRPRRHLLTVARAGRRAFVPSWVTGRSAFSKGRGLSWGRPSIRGTAFDGGGGAPLRRAVFTEEVCERQDPTDDYELGHL